MSLDSAEFGYTELAGVKSCNPDPNSWTTWVVCIILVISFGACVVAGVVYVFCPSYMQRDACLDDDDESSGSDE